jgi:hypothetical protein
MGRLVVVMSVVVALAGGVRAEERRYPVEVVVDFLATCGATAVQCTCELRAIEARYTLAEWRVQRAAIARGEMPAYMRGERNIVRACLAAGGGE